MNCIFISSPRKAQLIMVCVCIFSFAQLAYPLRLAARQLEVCYAPCRCGECSQKIKVGKYELYILQVDRTGMNISSTTIKSLGETNFPLYPKNFSLQGSYFEIHLNPESARQNQVRAGRYNVANPAIEEIAFSYDFKQTGLYILSITLQPSGENVLYRSETKINVTPISLIEYIYNIVSVVAAISIIFMIKFLKNR